MGISKSNCIVFEDILAGIKGAKAGGYMAIGVYDSHTRENQQLMKELSDKFIYDFKEMIA